MTTKVRNGKIWYVLHGVLEVETLALAVELLTDRRVTPRSMPEINQKLKPLTDAQELAQAV